LSILNFIIAMITHYAYLLKLTRKYSTPIFL